MFVNYDESILTYIASIRKYYGLSSSYQSDKDFDEYIQKRNPKQIILCLIDGMGSMLLDQKLSNDSFLIKHRKYITSTVFPPTTTAATTAILNGKAPNENAWLGWSQYFKEKDDVIVPFRNCSYYDNTQYEDGFIQKAIPVDNIIDELNDKGIKATSIYPYPIHEDGTMMIEDTCERIVDCSNNSDYKFIYAYWDKYDSLCHKLGPSDIWCNQYLKYINDCLENVSKRLSKDTMMVIVADHGHVDVNKVIDLYPKYHDYFYHKPSLEPRTIAMFVKEELRDEFEREFVGDYEDDFILLNHKQVIDSKLFGEKENNSRFEEFIGDYIAVAKYNAVMIYGGCEYFLKGQHAGGSQEELLIPVIVY